MTLTLVAALAASPAPVDAYDLERSLRALHPQYDAIAGDADHRVAQRGGMTLSQAIESVRRQGNVKRILSADTRMSGNREVHHIKYLTQDGKVRTARVQGRTRS